MNWSAERGSLRIAALLSMYRSGEMTPSRLVEAIYHRMELREPDRVWISRVPLADALRRAAALDSADRSLPLYGIPFAVKDNIDVEGMETTAGCPAFSYAAQASAPVVQRLLEAGAILVGKTNMDQFATGLVGVRSPYGIPKNPFDERYVPGGSSSGSAVAVSTGLVSFSLGTDTAGSGRVPAAFNNIVGWKPTPGAVSTDGVVPACRTLDCVSVFSMTCDDAARVAGVLADAMPAAPASPHEFRFGIPAPEQRKFFGNAATPKLFDRAIEQLQEIGGMPVRIDLAPLREAASLLYEGPWIAERTAALKSFLEEHPDGMLPVTRAIIEGGRKFSAVQAFEGLYRLNGIRRGLESMWREIDVLLLPTAGTTYRIDEVEADPVGKNTNLGYYTNFVNLLGYSALAVPSGFDSHGLPFGVTLIGPSGADQALFGLGGRLHRLSGLRLGATEEIVPARSAAGCGEIVIAVAGAHLRGLPLNRQLVERGAAFVRECRTAPLYRLYEVPDSAPPKPGLVRVTDQGAAIEVELWQMPLARFGEFVELVPPPLAIGSVILDSGEVVKGFLCEQAALGSARDISGFGGWKNFLAEGALAT